MFILSEQIQIQWAIDGQLSVPAEVGRRNIHHQAVYYYIIIRMLLGSKNRNDPGGGGLSPLDILALARCHLGTFNPRGGVANSTGKLEAIVAWACENNLGVVGLQEVNTQGSEVRISTDQRGDDWTLCTGGPSSGPKIRGTGFLISPQFQVDSFTALSPRVSWIKVRFHPTQYTGTVLGSGVACFVCGYAPTQTNCSAEEREIFYSDLSLARKEAQKACGSNQVPVVGDFNVNLAADSAEMYPDVIGNCLPDGESSKNAGHFLSFCQKNGLQAIQTFNDGETLENPANWATWSHPGLQRPHLKDFVLTPLEERTKVQTCRTRTLHYVRSDHKFVLCKVRSGAGVDLNLQRKFSSSKGKLLSRAIPKRTSQKRRGESQKVRLAKLDLSKAKSQGRDLQFQTALTGKLESKRPDWTLTEMAIVEAAEQTFPPRVEGKSAVGWKTEEATRELQPLYLAMSKLNRLAAGPNLSSAQLRTSRERARRAIVLCVRRHKIAFRKVLTNTVARVGEAKEKVQEAFTALSKGMDLDLVAAPRPVPEVSSFQFAEHFKKLFSKESEKETLGLTEQLAGKRAEIDWSLNGPPTLIEIETAVGKLSRDTASGANGLKPELFKLGGRPLAERLKSDFELLWPNGEEDEDEFRRDLFGETANAPRAELLQSWQDADITTLWKGKGSRKDPGNYRGIFILDVAGKVLASVCKRRLQALLELGAIGDEQCGFRKGRSTSHLIHALRRAQEAIRKANVKAFAVMVDFSKAFDSIPRPAIRECLEWVGCPPNLLAIVMAFMAQPVGRLAGGVFFRMLRGVRQGCVLGPILFVVVLEFCLRLAKLDGLIGIRMKCVSRKGGFTLPEDLQGVRFILALLIFADDLLLIGQDFQKMSQALARIQMVCGSIGLDISVTKTEWVWLHNPSAEEVEKCGQWRTEHAKDQAPCCQEIFLNGAPLRHVSKALYLGSLISETGGVGEETKLRINKAQSCLSKYSYIWNSPMPMRKKQKFLRSHVLPTLEYATECGNHTQAEVAAIAVFLNTCRRRLLEFDLLTSRSKRVRTSALRKKCKLNTPLGYISARRLAFAVKVVGRPTCELARRMTFAETDIQQETTAGGRGRTRSEYLRVLNLDIRYLTSGQPEAEEPSELLDSLVKWVATKSGPPRVQSLLKQLRPDERRGGNLRLVRDRVRQVDCPKVNCTAKFAERKEMMRHLRTKHSEGTAGMPAHPFVCLVEGCSRSFRRQGWLTNHSQKDHV